MYKFIYQTLAIVFLFTSIASADLVGEWKFNGSDGITGSTAIDTSGEGNNGTIIGAVAVAGKIGQALSFDGINDYVNCGHDVSLNIINAITIEAWMNVTSPQAVNTLNSKGPWLLDYRGSNKRIYWQVSVDGTFRSLYGTTPVEADIWYHIAATYDSVTHQMRLYINGEEDTASPKTLTGLSSYTIDSSPTSNLYIGKYSTHYFHGAMDEMRIYNTALTQDEVTELYQKGRNVLMNPASSGKIKINPNAAGKLRMGEE